MIPDGMVWIEILQHLEMFETLKYGFCKPPTVKTTGDERFSQSTGNRTRSRFLWIPRDASTPLLFGAEDSHFAAIVHDPSFGRSICGIPK